MADDTQQNATPKKAAMLIALESSMGNITASAKEVGIERSTHYRWLESDADYKSAVESLNDVVVDFAEQALFDRVRAESDTAIIFLLKTRGKKRGYVERTEQAVEHSGKINSVNVNIKAKK